MDRLKELRKEKNFSQKQVGDAVGIAQQTLSRYEKNINTIPMDALIRLSQYYHVTTDYILGISQVRDTFKNQSSRARNQQFLNIYKTLSVRNKELLWTIALKMHELEQPKEGKVPEEK